MRFCLFAGLILILVTGCTGTRVGGDSNRDHNIDLVAKDYFEGSYAVKTNNSNTFTIVYKNYKMFNELLPDIHYILIENRSNEVIFKDELKAGNVSWYSDNEVVAIERNLEVRNEGDPNRRKYLFNVITKQKKFVDY